MLAAIAFAFVFNVAQGSATHTEAGCPTGTSWDNVTQTCR
jgi:hypothetical protein